MLTANDRSMFLSTLLATRRDRTHALAMVGVFSLLFMLSVPFARVPLPQVPAFVASYQSALAVSNVVTAILLFSQLAILRSQSVLWLGSGYLFTAALAILHALTFPGLFAPGGLLGTGFQTTEWLYVIWHGAFPLFVLAYALTKSRDGASDISTNAILGAVLAIVAATVAVFWIVTASHDLLPLLLSEGRHTPTMTGVASLVWCLSLAALIALWLRRPQSVIDLWLMVVMCAWLFDVALSAIVNAAPFDLGYYAGQLYGLCAANVVLAILLIENAELHAEAPHLVQVLRWRAASARDIHTERERLFSAVVESSNDAIITKSLDGTITAWNRAAERLFGYSAAEAVGQRIDLVVPEGRRAELGDILARIRRGQIVEQHETVRIRKDGRQLNVLLRISPLRSATGEIIGATKIARDITERKLTQQALSREIEERQRIFETSPDLILVTDSKGTCVQVNPSSVAILGFTPGELIGRSVVDFVHPDDLESARDELRAVRHGQQKLSFEARFFHKDGSEVILSWLGTWSEPVRRYYFVGRDITERRAEEAQLRHAQKMDAVGQLTGGMAHDFNNILTVITGTIGILAEAVADRPELVSITTLIDNAAERGAQLTKHLLAFARKQPLQPREVDVNTLVLEAAKLLQPTLGEHVEISLQLSADMWPALVDPNQLATAILNLAINARDAMPDGGKLVLESCNVHLDDSNARVNGDVDAGDYVMIAVSDTGSGIPAEHLEKVFDPFFTTKQAGKGTGLGLSMVFGFVKQSGGHVNISSEVGDGTCVRLYLPRSTGTQESEIETMQFSTVEGGDETILVVEDDALVRQYVITQITSLGYTALEAANATEALKIIDDGADIDLLFTDVIMPGTMNGRQLADQAVKRRPGLKKLFTSGYTEDAIVHHGRLDRDVLLLPKPYRKPDLARMIRIALAS